VLSAAQDVVMNWIGWDIARSAMSSKPHLRLNSTDRWKAFTLAKKRRLKTMATRLCLTDTTQSAIIKMAEGNPGAVSVCIQLLKGEAAIDPDSVLGGLGGILMLDTLELYGSSIWMLYKDVCNKDLTSMCAVLRGYQLGFLTATQIRHAIENYGEGIDCSEVLASVKERLPQFGRAIEPPSVYLAHEAAQRQKRNAGIEGEVVTEKSEV
jgi:hypothetical protein